MRTRTYLIFWTALAISVVLVVVLVGCSSEPVPTATTASTAQTKAQIASVAPTKEASSLTATKKTSDTALDRRCKKTRHRMSGICDYIRAGNYSVVGQDGVYLGQLVPSGTSSSRYASICDASYTKTINHHPSSPYGEISGDLSAQAVTAESPPVLVDGRGNVGMYVTRAVGQN